MTLRVEHRLRMFGSGVLRRIFGPKSEEVTGEEFIMNFIICTVRLMHVGGVIILKRNIGK
jgi:hypothetical protein